MSLDITRLTEDKSLTEQQIQGLPTKTYCYIVNFNFARQNVKVNYEKIHRVFIQCFFFKSVHRGTQW